MHSGGLTVPATPTCGLLKTLPPRISGGRTLLLARTHLILSCPWSSATKHPWRLPVTVPANAAPVCSGIANITAYASLDTSNSMAPGVLSDYPSCQSNAVHCRLVAPARLVERCLGIEPRSLHDLTSFP